MAWLSKHHHPRLSQGRREPVDVSRTPLLAIGGGDGNRVLLYPALRRIGGTLARSDSGGERGAGADPPEP
jgi:hypothetical protein